MTITRLTGLFVLATSCLLLCGCATTPKAEDQPALQADARATTQWFESNVSGLADQIEDAGGYIVYPDVAQWGILLAGGKYGRGVVMDGDGNQVGWSSINTGSLGLQAGVQGFKMLIVFEDAATLEKFQEGRLTGSGSGVAVIGETGGSGTAQFTNGVAVYQGANAGLMAGVNFGLDLMRYEDMD